MSSDSTNFELCNRSIFIYAYDNQPSMDGQLIEIKLKNFLNVFFSWFDGVFMLPLSFYAIFAGAVIGFVTNIFTSLMIEGKIETNTILFISLLLCASLILIYLCITLEDIHLNTKDRIALRRKISNRRKKLYLIILMFFLALLSGIASGIYVFVDLSNIKIDGEEICRNISLKDLIWI